MKALFFDFTINFGGAPQGSIFLSKRLAKHVDVLIADAYGCCHEYLESAADNNIPVEVLHSTSKAKTIGFNGSSYKRFFSIISQLKDLLIVIFRLSKVVRAFRPDIVWANNEKSFFFLLIATCFFSCKRVIYYRGEALPSQIGKRFLFLINKFCDHVVVHSRVAKINLLKLGVPETHISYVPNCVEFHFPTEESNDLPPKKYFRLMLPGARPVLEKGYLTAVKAVAILKANGVNVEILLPGRLPHGEGGGFLHHLLTEISDKEIEDRVHFIGWRENLLKDMLDADLVVLPSHTEGFPRAIIEAMLMGVPVCATPVGGIPEAIIHNETGLLFNVDDFDGLAECIKWYMNNPISRESIVDRAKYFALTQFSADTNTHGVLNVFNRLVNKSAF